jgi:hypothetical protein
MNQKIGLGVIILVTLVIANVGISEQNAAALTGRQSSQSAFNGGTQPAISGDNIYAAWFTNKSGNWEVMFRASTDGGKTFGDKINLSNSSDADSTRVQVDSDGNSVVVTWWETNEASDTPVMKISTDNGKTFGKIIDLSAEGPIG